MKLVKKITDNVVMIAESGIGLNPQISLRPSGKEFINKEEKTVWFEDGKLCVDTRVASKFGLGVDIMR